jgi:hypothetical protein
VRVEHGSGGRQQFHRHFRASAPEGLAETRHKWIGNCVECLECPLALGTLFDVRRNARERAIVQIAYGESGQDRRRGASACAHRTVLGLRGATISAPARCARS